jgi:predicted PurR-regulated permease PerM
VWETASLQSRLEKEGTTIIIKSGLNTSVIVCTASFSFVICGTLVNTISYDFNGILLSYTEYLPVINNTASTITNHTIPFLSDFPKSGSVILSNFTQHFYIPANEITHSLTNSLPNLFSPRIEPSLLNSMYQLVISNRNLAITFTLVSFGAFTAWCVGIISNGLNVFFSNTFLSLKNFAEKVRNCMNSGSNSTHNQGSGSYNNTANDTGGGNNGNDAGGGNNGNDAGGENNGNDAGGGNNGNDAGGGNNGNDAGGGNNGNNSDNGDDDYP